MANAGNMGTIRTDLTLESASFEASIKKATASLNSNVAQMKRSLNSMQKSFDTLKNGVASFQQTMGGVLGFTIAGASIKSVLEMADSYKSLQGRIKLVTESTGDYVGVSRELATIAKQTGNTLEDN